MWCNNSVVDWSEEEEGFDIARVIPLKDIHERAGGMRRGVCIDATRDAMTAVSVVTLEEVHFAL